MASFFFNNYRSAYRRTLLQIQIIFTTMEIEQLKQTIQAKGFKVEHYESPMQFNIIVQTKTGDHCFGEIFTGCNVNDRITIKNRACEKLKELIKQN